MTIVTCSSYHHRYLFDQTPGLWEKISTLFAGEKENEKKNVKTSGKAGGKKNGKTDKEEKEKILIVPVNHEILQSSYSKAMQEMNLKTFDLKWLNGKRESSHTGLIV